MNNIDFTVNGGIGVATLDMPGRPFNVFSEDMIDELNRLIEFIETEADTLHGVVITSGKTAFMAGADLAMVQGFTTLRHTSSESEIRQEFSRLTNTLRRLERLPVTTVAAINGLALGGGLELAMACHHRIAVTSPTPTLGLPEILLGLLPGAGGTQRLPRLTSPSFAARMLMTGEPVTPDQALTAGLIQQTSDADSLVSDAVDLARSASPGAAWDREDWVGTIDHVELLTGNGAFENLCKMGWVRDEVVSLYPAFGAIARCLIDGYDKTFDDALEVEKDNFLGLMLDPVAGNMVRTNFINKTAAPKTAARLVGRDGQLPDSVQLFGVDSTPESLARLNIETGSGEIALCQYPATSTCAAELRFAGTLGKTEGVEIIPGSGSTGTAALMLANKLRLVPIVTKGNESVLARILDAANNWCEQNDLSSSHLSAIADGTDLSELLRRIGRDTAPADMDYPDARRTGLTLMTEIANEAARCLEEGLVENAESIDVLAAFAAGFPAWTGGPLAFLDSLSRGEIEDGPKPSSTTLYYPV